MGMSLDVTACLKALSAAFCQYRSHTSDQTAKDLERQIDVLIGITSSGKPLSGFSSKELLPAECLSSLVGLLNENNVKTGLYLKAMVLLFNLASDPETREVLHETYHLTSTLAAFLHRHNHLSSNEKLILQTLQLLQKITYCCKIRTASGYIKELIRFLIKIVQQPESDLTIPCLGLLANLSRHNLSVQAHIKALENVKSIYRTLIAFLSQSNMTVIILALSVLASLSLQEHLGERLFSNKNIHQTFQLVFNILINGEGPMNRKYSADLFTDLLQSPKIQQSLLVHDHLPFYVEQILSLLCSTKADEAAKIFELLLSFCAVRGLRSLVCKTLMCPSAARSSRDSNVNELYNAVMFWISQPLELQSSVPQLSLDFVKEIYEELVDSGLLSHVQPRLDVLMPVLSKMLVPPKEISGAMLKRKCAQMSKVLDAISVLCCEESLREQVMASVELEYWWKLLEYQYQHNTVGNRATTATSWSEEGVSVVLKMLDLLCKLQNQVPSLKAPLQAALQDQRLIPFLARAVSSVSRDTVQRALRILRDASALPEFQVIWLGEVLASSNTLRDEELSTLRRPGEEPSPPSSPSQHVALTTAPRTDAYIGHTQPPTAKKVHPTRTESFADSANIESLIEKMRSGLEIKDPRASEIMDVYEAKLAALVTKESHLQDLLEAKALALAQADRLISQYRCRRAQSEAECAKLRQLLQEAEKKTEKQGEHIAEMLSAQKAAAKEMEKLLKQNKVLEGVADEYEQLKVAFAEQSQRLDTSQRSLKAAQEEHTALSELNEMLKRHNENLKSQHDCATKQLLELEQECKNFVQQVKEKDIKCQDLKKALEAQEEETMTREKEKLVLHEEINTMRSELSKREQARKELLHKVSSLEVICRQHEEVIKERESALGQLQSELDRQAQIAAMIHSLSGGKVPITGGS